MYTRILKKQIQNDLFKGKVLILYGARQVGKTTLIKEILSEIKEESIYMSCDIPSRRDMWMRAEPEIIKQNIGNAKVVVLDEAQLIENIGTVLKVFYDAYPEIQVIATGSSSFDLANKIREPLTGRAKEYVLYPLSIEEILNKNSFAKEEEDFRFRFGMYPGMPQNINEAEEYLALLQNNTLYKDIFAIESIKKPKVLEDLVILLSSRIGSIISVQSLANEIKTTSKTIERYIDILEKMFIIIRVYAYSNNPSNERKKGYKVYFVDTGLRNSILRDHKDIRYRVDMGQVFENFFVMERIKYLHNNKIFTNNYFWQNYKQQEVDFLEIRESKITAYECKWAEKKSKSLSLFKKEYESKEVKVDTKVVSRENYISFLH